MANGNREIEMGNRRQDAWMCRGVAVGWGFYPNNKSRKRKVGMYDW